MTCRLVCSKVRNFCTPLALLASLHLPSYAMFSKPSSCLILPIVLSGCWPLLNSFSPFRLPHFNCSVLFTSFNRAQALDWHSCFPMLRLIPELSYVELPFLALPFHMPFEHLGTLLLWGLLYSCSGIMRMPKKKWEDRCHCIENLKQPKNAQKDVEDPEDRCHAGHQKVEPCRKVPPDSSGLAHVCRKSSSWTSWIICRAFTSWGIMAASTILAILCTLHPVASDWIKMVTYPRLLHQLLGSRVPKFTYCI